MSTQLGQMLADRKDMVEECMELLGKGTELLASTVGELFPVFEVAAPILKLALDNIESTEAKYMKEQFQKVRDKMEVISEEITRINEEIKKSQVDAEYFSVEENLTNQFRKYMDILNAKPKFKEVKKKLFLEHFSKTGGDKNLHTLYSAVTGDNFSGESILEITLNYEEKSRRPMEEFCARLMRLFWVGLIVLMGHAALSRQDEEAPLEAWREKMQDVEKRVKEAIADCTENFASQAETDVAKWLLEWTAGAQQELSDHILRFLEEKYDWISWSVRVYNDSGSCISNFWAGKKYQGISGGKHFTIHKDNTNVVVSYSTKPEPIDKTKIQELVESRGQTKNMQKLATFLHSRCPQCLAHAVSKYKAVAESNNFPKECCYSGKYKKACVFVYSD
ncbi:protein rapunzel-like [Lepisosteus oculatus]|uniref:protein rapunzel-like n=1 Tax=Lepisosteus oculatus TaxID=7918 RepID=UPI00371AAD1B